MGTIVVNRELVDWVREGVPLGGGAEVPWVPARGNVRDASDEQPVETESAG